MGLRLGLGMGVRVSVGVGAGAGLGCTWFCMSAISGEITRVIMPSGAMRAGSW